MYWGGKGKKQQIIRKGIKTKRASEQVIERVGNSTKVANRTTDKSSQGVE